MDYNHLIFDQGTKAYKMNQRLSLQQTVLEPLDTHIPKNQSRHRPYTFHKNELKIDHKPKYKTQTINVKK